MAYANHSSPISSGLCLCGCGLETSVAKQTDRKRGTVKGQPLRYRVGHKVRRDPMCMFTVDVITGCWNWNGHTDYGYARIGHRLAYRVIYERLRGPKEIGLQFDHLCRNRACVNPDHLELVTRAVNIRRSPHTVLNEQTVNDIWRRYVAGESIYSMARSLDVAETTVRNVVKGKTWRDVKHGGEASA